MSVYFITARALAQVKIGFSETPFLRLKALQTGSPVPLEMERLMDGGADVEAELHERFAEFRARGEWFHLSGVIEVFMGDLPVPQPVRRRRCAPTDIGALRAELGLTLSEFGALIGLASKGQVSQVEHGKFPCSLPVALEIERLSGGRIDAADLNDDVRKARHGLDDTQRGLAPATGQIGELSGGVIL